MKNISDLSNLPAAASGYSVHGRSCGEKSFACSSCSSRYSKFIVCAFSGNGVSARKGVFIMFAAVATALVLLLVCTVSSSATTVRLSLVMAGEKTKYFVGSRYYEAPARFMLLEDEFSMDSWVEEATEEYGERKTTLGPWTVLRRHSYLTSASVNRIGVDANAISSLVSYVPHPHDELIFFFDVPMPQCELGILSDNRDVVILRCHVKDKTPDFRHLMHMNALQSFLTNAGTGAVFMPFYYTSKKEDKATCVTFISLYDKGLFSREPVKYDVLMGAVPIKAMYADFMNETGLTIDTQLKTSGIRSARWFSESVNVFENVAEGVQDMEELFSCGMMRSDTISCRVDIGRGLFNVTSNDENLNAQDDGSYGLKIAVYIVHPVCVIVICVMMCYTFG